MTAFILGIWTPLSTTSMPRLREDGADQAEELAIAVPDQEPRPAVGIFTSGPLESNQLILLHRNRVAPPIWSD